MDFVPEEGPKKVDISARAGMSASSLGITSGHVARGSTWQRVGAPGPADRRYGACVGAWKTAVGSRKGWTVQAAIDRR